MVQNLRRVAGFDLQYFAAVEPQRRLAPHAHFAIRGTLSRAVVRQVVEATYHQVWWPSTEHTVYDDSRHPVWDDGADAGAGGYIDPDSGVQPPTWDDALDDLGDEPNHVLRFGSQVDVVGVLASTPEAERCIGYLVKYLTKSLGDSLDRAEEPAALPDRHVREPQPDHLAWHRDRLVDVLRTEPCSPTCPTWLRFGVQPKNARPGQRLGACRSKAHRPTHLGYAGRRVLASRRWTGKTLADHRADRRAFVLDVLGVRDDPATPAPASLAWEVAKRSDPDVPPLSRHLLPAIAQRQRWRTEYDRARELHACGPPAVPASQTKNSTGDAA